MCYNSVNFLCFSLQLQWFHYKQIWKFSSSLNVFSLNCFLCSAWRGQCWTRTVFSFLLVLRKESFHEFSGLRHISTNFSVQSICRFNYTFSIIPLLRFIDRVKSVFLLYRQLKQLRDRKSSNKKALKWCINLKNNFKFRFFSFFKIRVSVLIFFPVPVC